MNELLQLDMTFLEKDVGLANFLNPSVLAVCKSKDLKAKFKAELKYNAVGALRRITKRKKQNQKNQRVSNLPTASLCKGENDSKQKT